MTHSKRVDPLDHDGTCFQLETCETCRERNLECQYICYWEPCKEYYGECNICGNSATVCPTHYKHTDAAERVSVGMVTVSLGRRYHAEMGVL